MEKQRLLKRLNTVNEKCKTLKEVEDLKQLSRVYFEIVISLKDLKVGNSYYQEIEDLINEEIKTMPINADIAKVAEYYKKIIKPLCSIIDKGISKSFKSSKNYLNRKQLCASELLMLIVCDVHNREVEANTDQKDIFKIVEAKIAKFTKLVGKTTIPAPQAMD